MHTLTVASTIPPMTDYMIERVRRVEKLSRNFPQLKIPVEHLLHGGMYVRTVKIPKGVMITGALIELATTLIISGHAMIHTGESWVEREGYHVIAAEAGRKQIFVALSEVNLTMFFPTAAKTVKDAEEQFTNEADLLQNRGE